MALRNLLTVSGSDSGPRMVDAGLGKVVKQRKLQVRAPEGWTAAGYS